MKIENYIKNAEKIYYDKKIKQSENAKTIILKSKSKTCTLENINNLENSYKLVDSKSVLKEFRNKNIDFINSLKEKSIISDFKLIKDDYNAK